MKNLVYLFLFLTGLSAAAQNKIPNGGFENWDVNANPVHWQTTNLLLPPGLSNALKTNDHAEGKYALQLETIALDDMLVPGVATLGTLEIGFTYGGISFSSKPYSLSGFVKHPSSGDEVAIYAAFFRNGELVGDAYWSTTDSIPDFTPVEVPVNYYFADYPDTLNITLLTDAFAEGSTLLVDGLTFEETLSGVRENKNLLLNMFPNPVTEILHIDFPAQIASVKIVDNAGRTVHQYAGNSEAVQINMSDLKEGLYIVIIYSDAGIFSRKVLIQH